MGDQAFRRQSRHSISSIRFDLVTARILIWMAQAGQDHDLTPEAHLYLFDRYQRLADHHRRRGHASRADRLQARADEHFDLGGGGPPPYTAAMGLPRPGRWVLTNAVGTVRINGPKDAA